MECIYIHTTWVVGYLNIPKKGSTESLLQVNLNLVKLNAIPDLTFPLVYKYLLYQQGSHMGLARFGR